MVGGMTKLGHARYLAQDFGFLVNKVQGKDWKRGALFGGLDNGTGRQWNTVLIRKIGITDSWEEQILFFRS